MKTYTPEEIRDLLKDLPSLGRAGLNQLNWIYDNSNRQTLADFHGPTGERLSAFCYLAPDIVAQLLERVGALEVERASFEFERDQWEGKCRASWEKSRDLESERDALRAELAKAHETIAMIGGQAK